MELSIYTFGEVTPDPATGKVVSAHQRLMDLMEEIQLAEQVGLDEWYKRFKVLYWKLFTLCTDLCILIVVENFF